MTTQVLVNGKASRELSVFDRGLQYGDGLFETMKVLHGRPVFWERHMARLERGCQRLGIQTFARDALWDEAAPLCSELEHGVLKLMLTRGESERGYQAPKDAAATRIWQAKAAPDYPADYAEAGVKVRFCDTRLGSNPALAGIKHLNRLEQVLARREWDDAEIAEGLMLDAEGHVIEGVMSNLFVVADGQLMTPELSHCGVAGVMREWVLEVAPGLGIQTRVCAISREQLAGAEELFLTNSLMGLWPVRQVEADRFAVGPVIRLLQQALQKVLEGHHG